MLGQDVQSLTSQGALRGSLLKKPFTASRALAMLTWAGTLQAQKVKQNGRSLGARQLENRAVRDSDLAAVAVLCCRQEDKRWRPWLASAD